MRAIALVIFLAFLATMPATAAVDGSTPAGNAVALIKAYRDRPQPAGVPGLVKELAAAGAFQEPEAAGLYLGFVAGVLNANPGRAEELVASMASVPVADQWIVIKAIAYSGLPDWRSVMTGSRHHFPSRATMIEAYLEGKLPSFDEYRMEPDRPPFLRRAARAMTFRKPPDELRLEPSPALLDTFWGLYFATGSTEPLARIAELLRWSTDGNDLANLSIGSAAKYSLALNASRDQVLLGDVKAVRASADPKVAPILDEVIFAAETSETGRLREAAAAAIDELRQKGPAYRRKVAWWGRAGEGAIALGCVVAAVTGQVQLGIPCVIGGAATSAALKYFATGG